jgi:hypothetical protein
MTEVATPWEGEVDVPSEGAGRCWLGIRHDVGSDETKEKQGSTAGFD